MKIESLEEQRKIYENSPFNNHLGIKLEKLEGDSVIYTLEINPTHLNVNQGVHGGVYFSILDSVMGATIRSVVKQPIVTINMSINYFAPASNEDVLKASAKVLQRGRSIVTAEGSIEDADGRLLAKSIGTFKMIRVKTKDE